MQHMTLPYPCFMKGTSHFIRQLPQEPLFELVITSPPYNIGNVYEIRKTMPPGNYIAWQEGIIRSIYPLLKENGSICWQMGNYVEHGSIIPLDIVFAGIINKFDLQLRSRIIWTYGHGLHSKKRFSGRYKVVMWNSGVSSQKYFKEVSARSQD